MGYWDCPSCHTKKNLGPHATCAACGRPRGPNIPFYTDESAPVVEDPALVARARAGADWRCKYCGADNRAGTMDCHQCGAGPDGSVRRAERVLPIAPATPTTPAKKGSAKLVLGIIAGFFAFIGVTIWLLFVRTTSLQVVVESAAWIKTAQIEERRTRTDGAWQDKVPAGARVIGEETRPRSKQIQDGTKRVKVGQKDLGNGMFEDLYEEEPNMVTKNVDDTWVRYEIDTWVKTEKLETKSADGTEPPDPTRSFAANPRQRVGDTTDHAVFALKGSDGKAYVYEVDASKEGASAVTKYAVGKSYKAEVNALGHVDSLGP